MLLLLREYGSKIFTGPVFFSLSELAGYLELTSAEIDESLITLDNLGIIIYKKAISNEAVFLTTERVPAERLNINYKRINEGYLYSQHKLDQMVEYVFANECRFRYILRYFGEEVEDYNCGKCDRCKLGESVPVSVREYISEIILRTIRLLNGKTNQKVLLGILKGRSSMDSNLGLSTFGSCRNYDMNEVKIILQELITRKTLIKEGNSLWIKEEELLFIDDNGNIPADSGAGYEKDLEVFNLLREVRTKASKKFVQSAYLICPDDVLREVARQKPKSRDELFSIKGFNPRMFNKVGEDFLEIIKSMSDKNDKENSELPTNLKETYLLLKKGMDLGAIASMRKLSEEIISMQIETIIE